MYTSMMVGNQGFTITADAEDVDLAKYVKAGILRIAVTVAPGVTVGCSDWDEAAIWCSVPIIPDQSRLDITINGTIRGCNGPGGDGGEGDTGGASENGHPGSRGGTCVKLDCDINVYAALGIVTGGGGGGGGGAAPDNRGSNGAGGGGYPGGTSQGDPFATSGATSQYGVAVGGEATLPFGGDGGDCLGTGLVGEDGDDLTSNTGGAGGLIGYSFDAFGNTVTIKNGASNITGDVV